MAQINHGDVAAARKAAIRDAQRNAIEQVVGLVIKSSFSSDQKEVVANHKSTFSSKVEDRIYAKTAGYIDRQQVLTEERQGNTYHVTVALWVRARSLQDDLAKVDALMAAAGYPKVLLLVAESYTNQKGNVRWIDKPAAQALVSKALLAGHLEIMSNEKAELLRSDPMAYAALLTNDARIAELASEHGADVAIVGRSDVKFSAYNEMGARMYYVDAVVTLRAVRGSTGKVLASVEAEGRGTGVNENQARVMAVQKAAPGVADQLISQLITAWQAEVKRGRCFSLLVHRVRSYRHVAQPLIDAVEKLTGVRKVEEQGLERRTLRLQVYFNGSKKQLVQRLFDATAHNRRLRRLDQVGDSGDTIELSL